MNKFNIILYVLLLAGSLAACKKSEKQLIHFTLSESNLQLKAGETQRLNVQGDLSLDLLEKMQWKSTHPEVAQVNNEGSVQALKEGTTEIIAKYASFADTCVVQVTGTDQTSPLHLDGLDQPLSAFSIFSKAVHLKAPKNSFQSFDFDQSGNIYYAQMGVVNGYKDGESKAYEMYIFKGLPNTQVVDHYMTLNYIGHMSNIAVEQDNGTTYVWVNSNATRNPGGGYGNAQSVSRVKYEDGKVYTEGYAGESFFFPGKTALQPAIDKANDLLCINTTSGSDRYFYVFKLSEAMALPVKDFTVTVNIGGLEAGTSLHSVTRTVPGRDLGALTPVGQFIVHKGSNQQEDVNSFPLQGFDIDGPFIYFQEGLGYDVTTEGKPSQAYVTVFDLEGHIVGSRTKVTAIQDADALVQAGLSNSSGYMEPEGIKIKGNQIYLGYASRNGSNDDKYANILSIAAERE